MPLNNNNKNLFSLIVKHWNKINDRVSAEIRVRVVVYPESFVAF